MSEDAAFARTFAQLGATFRAQLPERLAELRRLADSRSFDELRAVAHQLAGRGGTFGAPEISVAARALEESPDDDIAGALDTLASVVERIA